LRRASDGDAIKEIGSRLKALEEVRLGTCRRDNRGGPPFAQRMWIAANAVETISPNAVAQSIGLKARQTEGSYRRGRLEPDELRPLLDRLGGVHGCLLDWSLRDR
jgi:hypothetical protein